MSLYGADKIHAHVYVTHSPELVSYTLAMKERQNCRPPLYMLKAN